MGHKKWAILQENIYSDCWDQDARLCCLFFTHTIWPKNNQYLNRNGFDQKWAHLQVSMNHSRQSLRKHSFRNECLVKTRSIHTVFNVHPVDSQGAKVLFRRTAKALIRLHGCAGSSESSLSTHHNRHYLMFKGNGYTFQGSNSDKLFWPPFV